MSLTLADLAARPELADDLPGGPLVAALAAQAAALAYRLAMRAACAPQVVAPEVVDGLADVLSLDEAARFLRWAPGTVAKRSRWDLGLRRCRVPGRLIRFSGPALREYARGEGPGAA